MVKGRCALVMVLSLLAAIPVLGQLGVIEKGEPTTIRGEVVEISCYQSKGIAAGTGSSHVACAKECAAKGRQLGVLTEGDGLFRIVGSLTADNHATLIPHLGQTVDVFGAQVVLSNTYDIRQNFEAQTITPVKN